MPLVVVVVVVAVVVVELFIDNVSSARGFYNEHCEMNRELHVFLMLWPLWLINASL